MEVSGYSISMYMYVCVLIKLYKAAQPAPVFVCSPDQAKRRSYMLRKRSPTFCIFLLSIFLRIAGSWCLCLK